MKKTIVIAMLAAGSALSMTHAFAAAGTVNFNGNILDAACDVDVASKNQVVVLGDYYKTEFPAAGSRADLPLHGSNGYSYTLSSTADNTLNFYAQYQSTNAAVVAGPANSVANFSVVYN